MRLLARASATVLVLALWTSAARADDDFDCDRSGDNVVTTADSLIALHDAVDTCKRAEHCDADGDGDETASDALALLRFSVDLPAELDCSCEYIDQCFGDDEDCLDSGFPEGYRCESQGLCVECLGDEDCAIDESCDPCKFQCTNRLVQP